MSSDDAPKFESELVRQLGRLVLAFGQVQITLDLLLASVIDQDQRVGRIIASHLQFAGIVNLVRALYITRHGEDDLDYPRLHQLLGEAKAISGERNRLFHSAWALSDDGTAATLRTPQKVEKEFKVEIVEDVKPAYVESLVERAKRLAEDLLAFHQEVSLSGKLADYRFRPAND